MDQTLQKQRDEIHRAIWKIANDLRGSIDGWDFKNYVLGTMFYRYISENIAAYVNRNERATDANFNYADISDDTAEQAREALVNDRGLFIAPSELFENIVKKCNSDPEWAKAHLNERLEEILHNIVNSARGSASEDDVAGLFDDYDVNNNRLGNTTTKRNERLSRLLNGVAEMRLGGDTEGGVDAFGDAYEYLMSMYAANAGKSGGEFFTPADVSTLLTKLATVGRQKVNKVYDPACGSGSLLLKSIEVLGRDNIGGFYGQEINTTTYNMCRINMFLHGVNFSDFNIACGDTLRDPQHWDDEPFDLIVSNPPYSISWNKDNDPTLINDPRFAPAGVLAPPGKADMAFVMHCLSWLSADGIAAIVCFPGIMYRKNAERKIRKYLVDNDFVDAVISMPSNLFYGPSITVDLLILSKHKKDSRTLFIDASDEFVKVTNNNRLTDQNIENIVKLYSDRAEVEHKAHLATIDEIKSHKYKLSVRAYVEPVDTREKVDIEKLNSDITDIVARENELRASIDKIVAEIEGKNE